MTSYTTSRIFVIGGTGAQGLPVIGALVADNAYSVRALSRDASSRRAKALLDLGNVEIVEGTFADEATLREGLRGCDGAYVNSMASIPAKRPRCTGRSAATRSPSKKASSSSSTATWTMRSRRPGTIPNSARVITTARAGSANGSCSRTRRTRTGWAQRSSPRDRTWRWRSQR
ncbi:MAG: NmrA family NAD(P)-binding protein [Xanthobacteraceae bacterium]|nr:NmrA family NAD(P)-binding protein [Xanthobacteraceae bacterium]